MYDNHDMQLDECFQLQQRWVFFHFSQLGMGLNIPSIPKVIVLFNFGCSNGPSMTIIYLRPRCLTEIYRKLRNRFVVKMDLFDHGEGVSELFQVQCHLYKHIFSYINSMSLKCAVQLGIPDIIHNHGQPITLPELVSKLHIHPQKSSYVHRLMRLLVHSGFFAKTEVLENKVEEAYALTPSSRLILKDNVTSHSTLVLAVLDPVLVSPWHFLGDWFLGSELTPFERAHGMGLWDYCNQNSEFSNIFNEAMANDSQLMSLVIKDYKPIFEGLGSLVDVGGGTGTMARIISEAFPRMKCMVFDLPHVVANLPDSKNLKYVGGDMFQSIPSADAILMKV